MSPHPLERAADRLVRRQHGVLTRAQALDLGATSSMIENRLRTGAWLKLAPGVYAFASHPPGWKRQLKAAQLSIEGAAVSHRSAAALHRIPGFRAGAIDLTVPPAGTSRSPLAHVHRRATCPTCTVDDIVVTTLARTAVDLAAHLDRARFDATLDDLLVRRIVRLDQIRAEHDRLAPGHPRGSAMVARWLDRRFDAEVPPANELERALSRIMDDPRLPTSVAQAAAPWWPDGPHRVDRIIPAWRRIVEADGRLWHSRERDFERDRARDHLAQRHGYEVTRFTYHQLVDDPGYAIRVLLDIGRRLAA